MQLTRTMLALTTFALAPSVAFAESGATLYDEVYGAEAACIGKAGKTSACLLDSNCGGDDHCYVYEGKTCSGSGDSTCGDGFECLDDACVHMLAITETYGGAMPVTERIDAGVQADPDSGAPSVNDASVVAVGGGKPNGSTDGDASAVLEATGADAGIEPAKKDDSGCSVAGTPSAGTLLPIVLALCWARRKRTRVAVR